jgi:enoyl-CoA hydratase/carnithine racemase
VDADDAVAVVVLTGVGPAFSAGVDLKELRGPGPPTCAAPSTTTWGRPLAAS